MWAAGIVRRVGAASGDVITYVGDRPPATFVVYGTDGDDRMSSQAYGEDSLYGGKGNDILAGRGGGDILSGDQGDDVLTGGDGNDLLIGGAGDDVLDGGYGRDQASGGRGRDTCTNAGDLTGCSP